MALPQSGMQPAGYIIQQHAMPMDRSAKSSGRWTARIPAEYRRAVLDKPTKNAPTVEADSHCLALLKHYRSLMPMTIEARKPMFFLKPADGAIGAHTQAVLNCYKDFNALALKIAERCGFKIS